MNVIQEREATYIVFTKSQHWFFKYLFKTGYNHCYVLIWDGYQWLILDKTITGTFVNTVEIYQGQFIDNPNDIFDMLSNDTNVTSVVPVDKDSIKLEYEHKNTNFVVSFLRPNSCVEYVKDYLGMNTLKHLSPYSLYKEIISK